VTRPEEQATIKDAKEGTVASEPTTNGGVLGYRRDDLEINPPYLYPDYVSTRTRAPKRPLVPMPHTLSEVTGPVYGDERIGELDHDLTRQHDGEPIGERIIVHGRLLDGDGKPVRNSLIEIWQANAGGRYRHQGDQHPAALDPNFSGGGRCMTDDDGRYEFVTIKPGAYPWQNNPNAWRSRHIHFSLFGPAFATRLITQMFFPGDPLFFQDPIFNSVRDEKARDRMICAYDHDRTVEEWALGYSYDIVLRGREATPMED
jgi:protocatechuate 3,4-dioxygenase, beta subunit